MGFSFVQWLVMGTIQGLMEWLPVSSEGMLALTQNYLWPDKVSLSSSVEVSLWLHLGTWIAALVYFRKDIVDLTKSFIDWKKANADDQKTIWFLIVSTLVSGFLGLFLLKLLNQFESNVKLTGSLVSVIVGVLLLITGWLQLKAGQKKSFKLVKNLKTKDGFLLGIAQGLAALPGFSRSGLTVSTLLLRRFDKKVSLRLSFLMSIPIVLVGNILLNSSALLKFQLVSLVGLGASFLFGWLTIKWLMRIAEVVNFGKVVIFIGILNLLAAFIT